MHEDVKKPVRQQAREPAKASKEAKLRLLGQAAPTGNQEIDAQPASPSKNRAAKPSAQSKLGKPASNTGEAQDQAPTAAGLSFLRLQYTADFCYANARFCMVMGLVFRPTSKEAASTSGSNSLDPGPQHDADIHARDVAPNRGLQAAADRAEGEGPRGRLLFNANLDY